MKGHRKTSNGRFRAEIYEDGHNINLGTFKTEQEAAESYKNANIERLRKSVAKHGYDLNDGVNYKDNYTVFNDGVIFGPSGIKLKPKQDKRGYMTCDIEHHNERVHRIVANCFIPNPENKSQVNHINGIKNDNRVENLEWNTPKENVRHAHKNNLVPKICRSGEKNGQSKLTEKDVKFIREKYDHKNREFNQTGLSRKFGVGTTAIHNIINNKKWNSI